MILLDTNALIWMARHHRRAEPLRREHRPLYVSPACLLELQMLLETGRVRLRSGSLADIAADARWALDSPASSDWFQQAWSVSWTRDPFDRLIVAHAQHRAWKLATGDSQLLAALPDSRVIAL
jgi:PIN domain nuclease of toxin-antitoxin system